MSMTVPITGTDHYPEGFRHWLRTGRKNPLLERDPGNKYDMWAVKVMIDGRQMGWVGRTHSGTIGAELDRCAVLAITSTAYSPHLGAMHCLSAEIEKVDEPASVPPLPKRAEKSAPGYQELEYSGEINKCNGFDFHSLPVGTVLRLSTYASRATIDLFYETEKLAYIHKEMIDGYEDDHWQEYKAVVIAVEASRTGRKTVKLVSRNMLSQEEAILNIEQIDDAKLAEFTKAANGKTPEPKPTPQKENTMNVSNLITTAINSNKTAATTAGYLEAGRIGNNQIAKLAGQRLPFMMRGYADTPIGKLLIANLASVAAAQLRPNDPTLAKLTAAMQTAAFQEIYQTVDLEGLIEGFLSTPEIKSALAKMPADDAPRRSSDN